MANKKGALYVITCVEKSRDYLFCVLDNAPKKYRYSSVRKIEQVLLDIDECLRVLGLSACPQLFALRN